MAPSARTITWFPGHMAKAMASLQRVIKNVDLVLEVRDARVPISSSNPKLDALVAKKRHIVVLNKADLVTSSSREAALHLLRQQGHTAIAATCSTPSGVKQVLREAVSWLQRERAASELSIMMAVGLPNSGKSSLINAMKMAARASGALSGEQAYNKRARVGDTPGLTRQVAGFQVAAEPCVYLLDTPGIMVPAVPSDEVGLRLALAGAIKDSVVGQEAIVRFLLQLLHTRPRHMAALRRSSGPAGRHGGGISGDGSSSSSSSRRKEEARRLAAMRAALLSAASYSPPAPSAAAGSTVGSAGGWQQQQQQQAPMPPMEAAAAAAGLGAAGGPAWHEAHGSANIDSLAAVAVAAADTVAAAGVRAGAGAGPLGSWGEPQELLQWFPDAPEGDEDDGSSGSGIGSSAAQDWRLELLLRGLGVAGAINPSQQHGALVRLLQAFRQGQLGRYCLDELPAVPVPPG